VSAIVRLLDLAGYVGLLLWGTHMVTSGVLRGYGSYLRRWLGQSLNHPLTAFLVGLVITAALQSSTATGLMATSFDQRHFGPGSGPDGHAGGQRRHDADSPGVVVQYRDGSADFHSGGRHIIQSMARGSPQESRQGLGLMLLALHLLVATMAPIEKGRNLRSIVDALVSVPLLALLAAGVATWLCHSSVAIVLLVVSLIKSGVIGAEPALALVLGANLGATLPPLLEAGSPVARRLPLGNLLIRAMGCVVALPLLDSIARLLARIDPDPARIVVNFHTVFNLALALAFIAPIGRIARLLVRLLPDPAPAADPGAPQYLEDVALDTASVALANATREALRMADMVQAILKGALEVFRNGDRKQASEISRVNQALDRLGVAVRRYLARLSGGELNEEDSFRSQEIFTFTINLDYVGDVVANTVMEFSTTRLKQGRPLAAEQLDEIAAMQAEVLESLNLGIAVFLRGEAQVARQLVARKALISEMETRAASRYFQHLRETRGEDGSADDFHLRILRDLKRIHSLIAALAYPILDRTDHLQNRMVQIPEGAESEPDDAASNKAPTRSR
jgi:phosphate:Na+ symporter